VDGGADILEMRFEIDELHDPAAGRASRPAVEWIWIGFVDHAGQQPAQQKVAACGKASLADIALSAVGSGGRRPKPWGGRMSSRCGIVQPLQNGRHGFNINADEEPLRFLVVEFETREDALAARDAVYDAINKAVAVTPSATRKAAG
jgi:hypothetical protein